MAEWSCSGLQIRLRRFDSDLSLQIDDNKTTTSASICIPTLNEEDHLPFLLNSIKEQVNLESIDLEIIISDSGSNDKTLEIAQSFLKASNIKYKILKNTNTNKSQNLNKAIEICKSEILIVIDAHCLLDKIIYLKE